VLKQVAEKITFAATGNSGQQPREWTKISEEFNKLISVDNHRSARQCRERWINTVDPNVKKGKWIVQEDYMILCLWLQVGNKWHDISL